jgi:hypothetical protein
MSSISHQQAVAEHWDLPNTEISQSKDVALGLVFCAIMRLFWQNAMNFTAFKGKVPSG